MAASRTRSFARFAVHSLPGAHDFVQGRADPSFAARAEFEELVRERHLETLAQFPEFQADTPDLVLDRELSAHVADAGASADAVAAMLRAPAVLPPDADLEELLAEDAVHGCRSRLAQMDLGRGSDGFRLVRTGYAKVKASTPDAAEATAAEERNHVGNDYAWSPDA